MEETARERYQKNVLVLALRWLVDKPGFPTKRPAHNLAGLFVQSKACVLQPSALQ